jgi:glycosyltransferase involved in cell wall biosynthesis
VQARIRKAWDVDAQVIHPPVDATAIRATASWEGTLTGSDAALAASLPESFLLGASRFVPYKRLDLAIRAGEAAGVPVVLAGSGPLAEELRAQAAAARVPVTVIPRPSERSCTRCTSARSRTCSRPWRTSGSCPSRPWPPAPACS